MRGEVAARPVGRDTVLPAVVDLYELEPERLQVLGRESRQFRQVFFIAGAAVLVRIPGAVTGGLRRQLDGVHTSDGVGISFQSQSCVVEPSERERFRPRVLARLDAQAAVVDLRDDTGHVILDR